MAPPAGKRVFEQIEQTAGYTQPVTYKELLGFYNGFALQPDAASGQFIPFTQVKRSKPEDRILFAVGLIPPAANITGRILDRTATAAAEEGGTSGEGSGTSAAGTSSAGTGESVRDRIVRIAKSYDGTSFAKNPEAMLDLISGPNDGDPAMVAALSNPNISTCALTVRGIWRDAGLDHPLLMDRYRPGYAIDDTLTIAKQYGAYYTGDDIVAGKYKIQPGDALLGVWRADKRHQHMWTVTGVGENGTFTSIDGGRTYVDSAGVEQQGVGSTRRQQRIDETNTLVDQAFGRDRDVFAVIDVSKLPFPGNTPGAASTAVTGDAASSDWQGSGAKNAKEAKAQEAKLAGSPLLSSATNKRLIEVQVIQARLLQEAIAKMASAPPLAMLVSPSSFGVKGEKIVNDGSWTRNGPIIEFWGDQQDKISGSGKVAGFFALDAANATGPGLTRMARNLSAGWANFQSLYLLYRNNGVLFMPDFVSQGDRINLAMVGGVYIYYDNTIYIGSFDSFNVTEADASPFTVEYNFEFTVRASFLLDRTDDQFTYGAPALFPKGAPIAAANSKNFEDQLVQQAQEDTLFGTPGDGAPEDFSTPE